MCLKNVSYICMWGEKTVFHCQVFILFFYHPDIMCDFSGFVIVCNINVSFTEVVSFMTSLRSLTHLTARE